MLVIHSQNISSNHTGLTLHLTDDVTVAGAVAHFKFPNFMRAPKLSLIYIKVNKLYQIKQLIEVQ